MAHEITYHVYPTDCDVFGHVNHATMITILEHARWALLESVISLRDVSRRDLWADGVWSVVRHVDIGYHWQSLPGDDLVIRSGLVSIGRTSYRIRQDVRHAGTGRLHAEATITFVCLDSDGRPVPVPERWRMVFPGWGGSGGAGRVGRGRVGRERVRRGRGRRGRIRRVDSDGAGTARSDTAGRCAMRRSAAPGDR